MFILKRFLFIINFALSFFLLELLINKAALLLPLTIFFIIFNIFAIWFLCFKYALFKKNLLLIVIPLFLLVGVLLSVLIIDYWWIKQALIALYSLLSSYYLNLLFHFFKGSKKYKAEAVGNLSFYISIFSFFLLAISLFSLFIFIRIPIYYLILVVIIFFFFSGLAFFWLSKINLKKSMVVIIVGTILSAELFFVISFWPVSYYVSGTILALFFFVFYGIFRLLLLDILNRQMVRNYLLITIIGLLTILFSAKWF